MADNRRRVAVVEPLNLLVDLLAASIPLIFEDTNDPLPYHDSALTGQMRYDEIMSTENSHRFLDETRLTKDVFILLVAFMKDRGALTNSAHICAGQKLMIFLTLLKGNSNREISSLWQHSGSTISHILDEVLTSFERVQDVMFIPPPLDTPDAILGDFRFDPYFSDCIGALDGSHIPASTTNPLFRNRKKEMSQNVLAVANFDMTFQYILAGWEGSAHDGQVLHDALSKGFIRRLNKYHLGDAGYALSHWCLTPYRGVRYHLKEWAQGNRRPMNARELFNLRHSSLRNVIERVFGVLKKRFPILCLMPSCSMEKQVRIVKSCFMIHNFIKINRDYEDPFEEWDENIEGANDDAEDDNNDNDINANAGGAAAWRDSIANAMWVDYQAHLVAHQV